MLVKKIRIKELTDQEFNIMYDLINNVENTVLDLKTQREIFTRNISNKNNFYLVAMIDQKGVGYLRCDKQLISSKTCPDKIRDIFIHFDSPEIKEELINELRSIIDRN